MGATNTGIQSLMYRGKMPYWTLCWSTGLVTWRRLDNMDNIDNVSYDKDSTSSNVLYYILYIEIDWICIGCIGYWIYIFRVDMSYVHMSNNQCFYCNSDNLSFPKSLCTSLFYFLQFGQWCWLDLLDVSSCFRIISWHGSVGSHGIHIQVWVKVLILIMPQKNSTQWQPFVKGKPLERIALMRAKCSQWLMKVGRWGQRWRGCQVNLTFKLKQNIHI